MDRRSFMLSLSAAGAAMLLPQAAEAATWVKLGTRKVNGLIDRDRISIGASWGWFDKIRLHVRGNNLWLYDLDIRFGNGAKQDVGVRAFIPQGGHTRTIDLVGGERFIKSVSFTYGKFPNGNGPTYVEVWGRR